MVTRALVLTALLAGVAGDATAQPSQKQLDILREAAAKGSAPAQYSLGAMAERSGDYAGAVRLYRQAANAGYAGAQFNLALLLDAGLGTAPDPLEAERLLQRAAAANFEPALNRLVQMERARAEASKSVSSLPVAAASTSSTPLGRSGDFIASGWGIGLGLALLAGAALFLTRSRNAARFQTATASRPRARRRH